MVSIRGKLGGCGQKLDRCQLYFPDSTQTFRSPPESNSCTKISRKGNLPFFGAFIVNPIPCKAVVRTLLKVETWSFFMMKKVLSTYLIQNFGMITAKNSFDNEPRYRGALLVVAVAKLEL